MAEETKTAAPADWTQLLDERMATHVRFARNYDSQFGHGAPGHLDLITINKLATLLDRHYPGVDPEIPNP